MALTDTNDIVMPVQPMYGGYGNGGGFGGFGGDWGSLIVLFLIAAMFGGFGGGFGFGGFAGGLGYDFPWLLNGQAGINANTNARFDNAAISGQLNGIQSAITNGFSSAEVAACGRAADSMQTAYQNEIAALERSFAAQTANTAALSGLSSQLAQCCCDNRLATANLAADIAREACATRTSSTQDTQAVLNAINDGFRAMSDQRYQDKIDAKNDEIAQLRQENLYARGQASQIAQNSTIIDGIYNRLNQCPIGTVPVFGEQPIFSCNNNSYGCGCSGSF